MLVRLSLPCVSFLGRGSDTAHCALTPPPRSFGSTLTHFAVWCGRLPVCVSAQVARSLPTSPSSLPTVGAFAPVRGPVLYRCRSAVRGCGRVVRSFGGAASAPPLTLPRHALPAHRTPLSGAQLLLLDSGLPVGPSRNLSGSMTPPLSRAASPLSALSPAASAVSAGPETHRRAPLWCMRSRGGVF